MQGLARPPVSADTPGLPSRYTHHRHHCEPAWTFQTLKFKYCSKGRVTTMGQLVPTSSKREPCASKDTPCVTRVLNPNT